ncbi:MAG: hypothetical protein KF801_04990 [Cryobacterium sp.]|jgi:hypothetical protein|nr:hypothetical protein [Cryobacterium sp.]
MPDNTPAAGNDIHRLLDDAFAGIALTPEVQDLKEEVRANLLARVAELEASGTPANEAARTAIEELGDVQEFLDSSVDGRTSAPLGKGWSAMSAEAARHRVRPKPAFVVRIVIASAVVVGALKVAAFSVLGALPLPIGVVLTLVGLAASGAAWIVGDSLTQETTTNHPVPAKRAAGYWLATFLFVIGAGFGGLVALGALPVWAIVFASIGVIAAIILFAFLGATQTNRHKAWVKRAQHPGAGYPGNRFEEEPETAARFGIYTMVIWVTSFVVFLVLSFTIGWSWSWLAFIGGFLVMMLTLARMLFGPRKS